MVYLGFRLLGVALAASLWTATPILAQSTDQKPAEPAKNERPRTDQKARGADEIAEAAKTVIGPAGNPECVWLGQRAVRLLWRDDLDTAQRHLDLYDRFSCPGAHIQATFRCVIRQGEIDPKATETANARVHSCWINPAMTTAAAPAVQAAPSKPASSTTR